MSLDAGLTLLVVLAAVVVAAREITSPDAALAGALVILMATGVIDVAAGLRGFGNPAVATVGALFIVAAGLRATGALEAAAGVIFRGAKGLTGAAARVTVGTAGLSAFLNNTPIVAMGIPAVSTWSEGARVSPSRLLVPLSYASILGGVCTLMGTSTNLVSDGLFRAHGLPALGFFELGAVGLPMAVVGLAYLTFVAPRLLSDRVPIRIVGENVRRYTAEMEIAEPSALTGRTVEEAGLRRLPGLFLVRIERETGVIAPVDPGVRLFPGDRLTFAGVLDSIVELRRFRGLVPVTEEDRTDPAAGGGELHEAVVSPGSPLVGTSIRDANFRGRYNAAVVAVHRHGERIRGRIGDIVLRPGDTLLLEAAAGFARTFRDSPDFYLVSPVAADRPPAHDRRLRSVLVLAGVVLLAALRIAPISLAAMAGAVAMVAFRCLTPGEAKRSVDWSVLVLIGCALGLAAAMERSGAAAMISNGIVAAGSALGPVGTLGGVFVGTMLINSVLTNTAAVALVFPVALTTATQLGLDPRPFLVAATLAASFSFSTPIGYQTNLMVYGPGGYRFTDFTRVGLPLQLLLTVMALLLIPAVWPLGG